MKARKGSACHSSQTGKPKNNFDGKVDAADMVYVVKNFGLQNPTASNPPKAKKTYKETSLDEILNQLGIN